MENDVLEYQLANFFGKGPANTYFRFCGPHTVTATLLLQHKAAVDHTYTSKKGCVSIKLYLEKEAVGRIGSLSHILPFLV